MQGSSLLVICVLSVVIAVIGVIAHGDEPHPLSRIQMKNIRYANSFDATEDIKITASPEHLEHNGDWVDVEWSGVTNPKPTDFIAVYSPAGADVHTIAAVKWLELKDVPGYLKTGSGKHRFRLINLRADNSFVFYTGSFEHPVFAAQSNAVRWTYPNVPTGVHLSLHTTSHVNQTMAVVWNSATRCTAPRVQWAEGTKSVDASDSSDSTGMDWPHTSPAISTTTYGADDMCGEPATKTGWLPQGVGYFQTALMTDLIPGQTYRYRVGDDTNTTEDGGWSATFEFVTPPAVHPNASFDVFAFGDLGQTQVDGSINFHGSPFHHSRETTLQIAKKLSENPEHAMVWHIGDLGYARGYASEWVNFADQIEPVATQRPWMLCIGNHERDWPHSGSYEQGDDSGGECGVPYGLRFTMPVPVTVPPVPVVQAVSGAGGGVGKVISDTPWYGMKMGSVHLILMSTEHDYTAGSPQHKWISDELGRVDRSVTPWLVFAGHRPAYFAADTATFDSSQELIKRSAKAQGLREALEELWYKNGVDLALFGHVHTYQRTCPVYKEKCYPAEANGPERAPVHLVIGHAGAGLNPVPKHPSDIWRFVDDTHYGFITLSVRPDALTVRSLTSVDGSVMDEVVIPRNQHW